VFPPSPYELNGSNSKYWCKYEALRQVVFPIHVSSLFTTEVWRCELCRLYLWTSFSI